MLVWRMLCPKINELFLIFSELPKYHTRCMRREFISKFGTFSPSTKPYVLRQMYRELTGELVYDNYNTEGGFCTYIKRIIMYMQLIWCLCGCYSLVPGDSSASANTHEDEIDNRLKEVLLMEDPDILVDLNSRGEDNFSVFWKHCESFLQECTAVHERRHGNATYLARALSVRDLIEQVSALREHLFLLYSRLDFNFTQRICLLCTVSAYLSK